MKHLVELTKIIEGGLKADRAKVINYTELLADKLEKEGDTKAAKRFRQTISPAKESQLEPSNVGFNGRLPFDQESHMSLVNFESVTEEESVVFINEEAQRTVDELIRNIKYADKLISAGLTLSPSLLVYGPPGCGKTELARNISAKLGLPLLTARTDGIVSSYLGSTAKNLRALFEHAMGRPCVLFLDEFDAVAKLRDDRHELGELKRVVVSLLQNIDNLDGRTILIAATNHHHLLDSAVWRRFGYKIYLGLPDAQVRRKLFERFLGSFDLENKCLSRAVSISEELSGSDIRQAAEDALRAAVMADKNMVDQWDLLRRLTWLNLSAKGLTERSLGQAIRAAREINPTIYSHRVLGEIFNISKSSVGNYIKSEE